MIPGVTIRRINDRANRFILLSNGCFLKAFYAFVFVCARVRVLLEHRRNSRKYFQSTQVLCWNGLTDINVCENAFKQKWIIFFSFEK